MSQRDCFQLSHGHDIWFLLTSTKNLFFLSYLVSKLEDMKDIEIIKLLESVGIDANFVCSNHNDSCDCHRIYDEAA